MLRTLGALASARPRDMLALFCLSQIVLWTVLPGLASSAPALDVANLIVWGQEWQLGYYKHPPLPAWLLEIARLGLGGPIWGPLLLSQIFIALTYLFVFLLGRRLLGERDAVIGTALLAGVYYFSWPTPEFNHNVVQMPLWAAAFFVFSLIHDTPRRLFPWLALGLIAGIGLYAKYSVLVQFAVFGLWVLADPRLRPALRSPGPWLGAILAVVLALPHLLWLIESDFLPIAYARERSALESGSPWRAFDFVLTQAADHLPMLLPLALGLLPWRRAAPAAVAPAGALRFLAIATFGPALFTALVALTGNTGVKDMWGAPMFATSGLFVTALIRSRLGEADAGRLLAGCFALVAGFSLAYALQVPVATAFDRKMPRIGYPMAEIGAEMTRIWRDKTGKPLVFVGGDGWISCLVSLGSDDSPSVLFDWNHDFSPWIGERDIETYGILAVWRAGQTVLLPQDRKPRAEGSVSIPWDGPATLDLHYAIYD
ncbi:glycosyltransferase family 39 protein [Polymorphum gilvum]|uniref:Putative 4-amino-4-deoxy-L-arabinose transferase and related glycosyltransferase of PMT family n=1 Tax=Polymorphum gilvum (strain LMG 25793 / CGMCC 1.9160 / SL003B-26A1) TaxID=991905 RepID=F2IVW2_POLGS|nr:glycosyltransferase family 39 protein [Polymorphum gilvum]ADZ69219.1 Putative 4-amino-4-deoxy-L-arabinose transferase and related glycosyltransferase of PMT family [Polymorphum gilvum SL003B-26A1]